MTQGTQSGLVQPAPRTTIVALDLGTHGSGLSVSSKRSGSQAAPTVPRSFESWPDQPLPYPKNRSALLYNSSRKVVSWGWAAIKEHAEMSPAQQAEHRLVPGSVFKLGLADPAVAARLPYSLTCEQVVADLLTAIKPVALDFVRRELGIGAARPDNIQWCLTLPAMWSDEAKQTMRRAALKAGLIRTEDSDALCICLEPEAATVHALASRAPPLNAGGGTVDTTLSECKQVGNTVVLAEAVAAEGVLAGGSYVDEEFQKHMKSQVGEHAYDTWVAQHPRELAVVTSSWEAVKRGFKGSSGQHAGSTFDDELGRLDLDCSRVPIPPGLHALMTEDDKVKLRCEQDTDTDLELPPLCLEAIFAPCVQAILGLAHKQLDALEGTCDKVLLVGGFASSLHLQSCVRSVLEPQVGCVFVPPRPYAAVLDGAVLYGLDPELIHARRARQSYGIRACAPYEEGAPGKFWNHEEACFFSDCIFSAFVWSGDLVGKDEVVEHFFIPMYAQQASVDIELFASTRRDFTYILDNDEWTHSIGTMTIDLPPSASEDRVIAVTLLFGRTEITASARDENSGRDATLRTRFAQKSS